MTLDEAITHALEQAEMHDKCGAEHKQLARWLQELKELRVRIMKSTPSCDVCSDTRWVRRHELPDGSDWDGSADDTQYACPYCEYCEEPDG